MLPMILKYSMLVLPAALLGFVVIATQKTKENLVIRAFQYLGSMLLIVMIPLTVTQVTGVTGTDSKEGLVGGVIATILAFWVAWITTYFSLFRQTLKRNR